MKKSKIVKTFYGTHRAAAQALADYLQEHRVAPGHVQKLTCLESANPAGMVSTVRLILLHDKREPDDKASIVAKVGHVVSGSSQQFEKEVMAAFEGIETLIDQTITSLDSPAGGIAHLSWFAIYY